MEADITLHLTEHHGDGCSGSRVHIITLDVVE
ncbi:glyoxalase superfamily protein [Niastella yeongjuensis]